MSSALCTMSAVATQIRSLKHVQAGNSTLLRVTVTPGRKPASTGLAVTADLGSLGDSATQQFFDDGCPYQKVYPAIKSLMFAISTVNLKRP